MVRAAPAEAEAGEAQSGAAEGGGARTAGAPAGVVVSLEVAFSYSARSVLERDGPSVRLRLPLLTGPPMAGGEPGAVDVAMLDAAGLGPVGFSARLEVPRRWRLSDAFPTGLRRTEDGVLHAELATAPAMIGLRARTDGSWSPGLPLVVDLLALAVLTAFALRGWLHLRGVVAGRRDAAPGAAPGRAGAAREGTS